MPSFVNVGAHVGAGEADAGEQESGLRLGRGEAVIRGHGDDGTHQLTLPRGLAVEGAPVLREVGADMVEHTVEQHPQPLGVRVRHEVVEVVAGPQPRVDPVVVGGVVTVCAGSEYGAERDPGRPEGDDVIEPRRHPAQPVLVGRRWVVRGECADEAQWVDVPPDGVGHPPRFGHGRNLAS